MIRGMGIRLQDAIQGPFRKKKVPKNAAKTAKAREVENLESDVQVRYLSSRQLEEAALAERYLLENLDHGSDFKKLFYLKHQFLIAELQLPSFCDLCGLLIWGIYRLSLRCRNCDLTCHPQCKQFLRLVCPKPRPEKNQLPLPAPETDSGSSTTSTKEAELWQLQNTENGKAEVLTRQIDEFNKAFPFSLLQQEGDGSLTGFVKILLRLKRPVTVSNGPFPRARVTSFYLPRNSEKLIHMSSQDDTSEAIEAILTKFRMRDDPRKFCLYLEDHNGTRVLEKDEHPLLTILKLHETSSECGRLILEESDPKNVLWDAFSLPELENFKLILDREEEEMEKLIRQNYEAYRTKLMEAFDLGCANS